MDTNNPPVSLGPTAIEVWRTWRSLPWQGLPTYGNALATRPATAHEEDEVWSCLLTGALRIYNRRNGIGVSMAPIRILHEMTGKPIPSGLSS